MNKTMPLNLKIKIPVGKLYKDSKAMASKLFFVMVVTLASIIVFTAVRGLPGNPNALSLNSSTWKEEGPFELSPERGRFALTYNIAEYKSLYFPVDLARFATPDVGYANGKYVSLFMPGPSVIMLPGYIVGKYFGVAQIGTTLVVSFFALLNFGFIYLISKKLGANDYAAILASIAFLFGSPAFTYAVTLYQHHISTFFILLPIYILLRDTRFFDLACVWFILAFSVILDIPNLFTAIPIGLYALTKIINTTDENSKIHIKVKPVFVLTFVTAIIPLAFLFWYNMQAQGDALKLPGSNQQASVIDANGKPGSPESLSALEKVTFLTEQKERDANVLASWFETRNLLQGFQVHFTSPDRGMFLYTPIMFLALFAMIVVITKYFNSIYNVFIGIIGINVLLYSMWGDPWGGWAFGSRYLVPTYAILAIFFAQFLTRFSKKLVLIILVLPILFYSIRVNTIGAITTSKIPPKPEVLALEQLSGKEEKYTYAKNIDQLNMNSTKSFVHNTYLKSKLTAWQYFGILYIALAIMTTLTSISFYLSSKETI